MKNKNIIIASGGTGGHIFPAIATAEILLNHGYKITFVTDKRFDKFKSGCEDILERTNFSIKYINISPIKSKKDYLIVPCKLIRSIFSLMKLIFSKKISLVIGFGSYVSLPAILAGTLSFRKTMLHEQNTVMGISNKISLWFVSVALSGFPEITNIPKILQKKVIFTGNPVRNDIKTKHYKNILKNINYEIFFKIYEHINILILGGSQGATFLNKIIPTTLGNLEDKLKKKLRIFHQCGQNQVAEVRETYKTYSLHADVRPFFGNIAELMSSAHLMISRSGASTIAEIMSLGTPTILIPLPDSVGNHQLENAVTLSNKGAAITIQQRDVNQKKMTDLISQLLNNHENLAKISQSARLLAEIDADIKIASLIETSIFGKVINKFNNDKIDKDRLVQDIIGTS